MRLKKKYRKLFKKLEIVIELALLIILAFNLRGRIDGALILYILIGIRFLNNIK